MNQTEFILPIMKKMAQSSLPDAECSMSSVDRSSLTSMLTRNRARPKMKRHKQHSTNELIDNAPRWSFRSWTWLMNIYDHYFCQPQKADHFRSTMSCWSSLLIKHNYSTTSSTLLSNNGHCHRTTVHKNNRSGQKLLSVPLMNNLRNVISTNKMPTSKFNQQPKTFGQYLSRLLLVYLTLFCFTEIISPLYNNDDTTTSSAFWFIQAQRIHNGM